MDKTKFNEFLETVDDLNRGFAAELHTFLLEAGCKCEIKSAKSGYTVSFVPGQTGKTLATFVCRKTGVRLRIFPSHIQCYDHFLDTLPAKMKKDIQKSSVCKRLINPDDCNSRCSMGYEFMMDQENYKKCRYMAFLPALSPENNPFIRAFLEKELHYINAEASCM